MALAAFCCCNAAPPSHLSVSNPEKLQWLRVIATANDDWINDLSLLANGNIAAGGFINRRDAPPSDWSGVLIELRPDGTINRQSNYGEGAGIDAVFGLLEAAGGERVLAGFTTRIGHGGIDGLSILTRADGTLVHEEPHGGPGYDRFTDVALAPDGYVFVGHSQAEHSDKRRVFLIKTDRAGRKLWEHIHDDPSSWGALYIEPAPGGGYIIGGGTSLDGDRDMFAMKVDASGREIWRRRAGTKDWNEINHGLVVRGNGDIVLVGYTNRGEGPNDLVAAVLSPGGEIRKLERWGGGGDDRAILARPASDGRIWIVGHTATAGAGDDDALVTSLDQQGSFEGGAVTLGGPADDRGTAVLPLAHGSLIVAGYSRSLGPGGEDAFVGRLSRPEMRTDSRFRREVVVAP